MANGYTQPEVDRAYAETGRVPPVVPPRSHAEFQGDLAAAWVSAEVAEVRALRAEVAELRALLEQVAAGQANTAMVLAPAALELATTLADVRRLGPVRWARKVGRDARRQGSQ